MALIVVLLVFLLIVYLPQVWVQRVLARHHRRPEDNFPGTGGELAQHLLEQRADGALEVGFVQRAQHRLAVTRVAFQTAVEQRLFAVIGVI